MNDDKFQQEINELYENKKGTFMFEKFNIEGHILEKQRFEYDMEDTSEIYSDHYNLFINDNHYDLNKDGSLKPCSIIEQMKKLTDEQRSNIIHSFCIYCGSDKENCWCRFDD